MIGTGRCSSGCCCSVFMAKTSAETGLKLPGLAQKKPALRRKSLRRASSSTEPAAGKIVAVRDRERDRHSGAEEERASHITPVGIDL